jgi:hypothetical protein
MDIVGLLNGLTGGHLLLWKVVLTSVVFVQAGVQVMLAARLWGAVTVPPVPVAVAARAHRLNGRATVVLALLVAFTCLAGPAGPVSPPRVLLHSIFGSLLFVLLALKYWALKLSRRGSSLLPWFGAGLFVSFGAIWATSVADYITAR